MNFRERLLLYIQTELTPMVIPMESFGEQIFPDSRKGITTIVPNEGYATGLRYLQLGPIETLSDPTKGTTNIIGAGSPINELIPALYLSFDGGRNDGASDTFITHLVETLAIRIDVVLNRKIGVNDGDEIRPMTLQVSDVLADIQKVMTQENLGPAVHRTDDEVTLQEVYLEEWGFDQRFHGGDIEVLQMRFECAVAAPHGGG